MKRRVRYSWLLAMSVYVIGHPRQTLAANWIALQAVSPPTAPPFAISGFLEPLYTATDGTRTSNGAVPHENLGGPEFTSSHDWSVFRARLMARGYLNQHFSYFFAGEFGDNGFTNPGTGYSPRLQDGHVTVSYIPGVRVEAGILRAPGPEGAMQGYMAYNFTAFPSVIQQLMFQSFYNPRPGPRYAPSNGGFLVPESSIQGTNAFRYTGISAVDWFRSGDWEFAYDAMVGDYAPLTSLGSGDGPIYALRTQESYILGGAGPFRSDVTGFVWYQYAHPVFNGRAYALNREGVGVTYMQNYMHRWGRWFKAEYMQGSGMIGTPPAFSLSTMVNSPALYDTQVYPGIGNHAYGYYAGLGLFVTPKLEVDFRYDYYNRLTNNESQNRVFQTWTTGLQYHITPLTKIMVDYAVRKLSVPLLDATAPAVRPLVRSIAQSLDNQFSAELVVSF